MTSPQRDNSEMLPLNGTGVVIGTWSAGSENRPTKTYSFGINTLVGEALSLPRSTGFQLPTRMGEERTTLNIVPFNQTLRFVAWREAKSLPYSGVCIIFVWQTTIC